MDGPEQDAAPDQPRALRDASVRAARRAMLSGPHMVPLTRYVDALRASGCGQVPDFDPLDGGADARVLLLLEKPSSMTDPRRPGQRAGSGFVSRDNDDHTAEACWRFMRAAGLPRRETAIWNLVPWWNGTIRITAAERRKALPELPNLLGLFPRLRTVLLAGRTAQRAEPFLFGFRVLKSAHPSIQVRISNPTLWAGIPAIWQAAAEPFTPSLDQETPN